MQKIIKKFLVWIGIMQMKPTKEIRELIERNVKIEEQTACEHKTLKALFPNDIWYKCVDCNEIWIITDAMTLNAKTLPKLVKKLKDADRKNSKTYSLDEARKSKDKGLKELAKKIGGIK